eukprot:4373687-Pyramimonas_sp.AAC.1
MAYTLVCFNVMGFSDSRADWARVSQDRYKTTTQTGEEDCSSKRIRGETRKNSRGHPPKTAPETASRTPRRPPRDPLISPRR